MQNDAQFCQVFFNSKSITMKNIILSCLFFFLVLQVNAQQSKWQQVIDRTNWSATLVDVCSTNDGNFILLSTLHTSDQSTDFHLLKVDPDGNHLWSQTIDVAHFDFAKKCVFFRGGIYILGEYQNNPNDYARTTLIRVAIDATIEFTKFYEFKDVNLQGTDLYIGGINDLYISGQIFPLTSGVVHYTNIFVMRLKSNGNKVWMKEVNSSSGTNPITLHGPKIFQYVDGDIYLGASVKDKKRRGVFVMRMDNNAHVYWSNNYLLTEEPNYGLEILNINKGSDSEDLACFTQRIVNFEGGQLTSVFQINNQTGALVNHHELGRINHDVHYRNGVYHLLDEPNWYEGDFGALYLRTFDAHQFFAINGMRYTNSLFVQAPSGALASYQSRLQLAVSGVVNPNQFPSVTETWIAKAETDGTTGCNESILTPYVGGLNPVQEAVSVSFWPFDAAMNVTRPVNGKPQLNKTFLCFDPGRNDDESRLRNGKNPIPSEQLIVYPNPAQEVISLSISDGMVPYEGYRVVIYNVQGEGVQRFDQLRTSEVELDIAPLSPGIYWVEVEGMTTKSLKGRFLKL